MEPMSSPNTVDDLLLDIARDFETLPPQLQSIASYLERQRANIMVQRINEVAEGSGVHPSAVVRFAKRFGFSGYRELQSVFRSHYTDTVTPTRSYQQRVRQVIADGQAMGSVDLLVKAENIYVVAVRRTFSIASYFVYALQHTHKRVHLVSGLGGMYHEQIRSIGRNDVLIAISFPPYGRETLYCSRVAQQHKAHVLAITDSALGPLGSEAKVTLKVSEGSAFGFRGLASTICLCQSLFVALAYKLELKLEETSHPGGYDD
jgi:DNA-binding MurR/RpiR family transcriptional regulator